MPACKVRLVAAAIAAAAVVVVVAAAAAAWQKANYVVSYLRLCSNWAEGEREREIISIKG